MVPPRRGEEVTTMAEVFEQAENEVSAKWGEIDKPCRYGHLDCSDMEGGRCWTETVGKRAAEILARGAMEAAK